MYRESWKVFQEQPSGYEWKKKLQNIIHLCLTGLVSVIMDKSYCMNLGNVLRGRLTNHLQDWTTVLHRDYSHEIGLFILIDLHKFFGWYWKIMWRQFCTLECSVSQIAPWYSLYLHVMGIISVILIFCFPMTWLPKRN